MCVSPDRLAMHIAEIRKHFEIVDLSDWIHWSRSDCSLPERACALTFDDGWKDNYEFALPILVQFESPCTVFLVADLVDGDAQFWPNTLVQLMKAFPDQSWAAQESLRRFLKRIGANPRTLDTTFDTRLADDVIVAAKVFSDAEIASQVDELASRFIVSRAERSLLNRQEIAAMGDTGLVRFGSHGARHVRLSDRVAAGVIETEVIGSRDRLRSITASSVELFCYPNGEYSLAALNAVRKSYAAAVTTECGWNWSGTDPYRLRRISLHDNIAPDNGCLLARVSGLL